MNLITMTPQEIDRHGIITRLISKEINGTEAANILHLSVRQTKRLKAKVKKKGAEGLAHASRGKAGHHRLEEKEKKKIVQLLKKHYYDFGPTFAAEKLRENHAIDHDQKTIRQIMIGEKLWQPKIRRSDPIHRTWRERRVAYGEMEQFDGSYEYWFEDRAGKCCLLGAIDDATGNITKLVFAPSEGVLPVMSFWQGYAERHGKPLSIYLDKFSTYNMNHALAKENSDTLTQFERACQEFHIELIKANSPQAKGRIERLWHTLQDRLIKELRLANISTIAEANIFVEKIFIPKFNKQFGVVPRSDVNLHLTLAAKDQKQLPAIYSRQTERTVQNDFTFSFDTQWFQLTKDQPATICKKDKVIVEERTDGTIHVRLRGKYLNYKILPTRPMKTKQPWIIPATQAEVNEKKAHTPAPNHPWRLAMTNTVTRHQTHRV
ncbi:MAG: Integrase catalytic protein [Candidatus Magasanikbacteria bacterium]|nr:Integrase catalytic protein [Candidatus Magasanikbacteria bacterium]